MAEPNKPSSRNTNPPQHFSPTPSSSAPESSSKKRPLNQSSDIQDSNIFKMRSLLKDLRPDFIEAINNPDFRNSKAADGIREKMELFMEEYRKLTKPEAQFTGDIPRQHHHHHQPRMHRFEDFQIPRTYIVGGSAVGWNYITTPGDKAVYYGVTKEMHKSAIKSRSSSGKKQV